MSIRDFENETPRLVLEDYFAGKTYANGMLFGRSGTPKRSFSVDITGTQKKDGFELYEQFVFSDGEKQERTWMLKRTGENTFEGRASDVVGVAKGVTAGNAVRFNYTLQVPVDEKIWNIQLNDWMFLQEGGVLFNRATMSKFGFDVGELIIFFRKTK